MLDERDAESILHEIRMNRETVFTFLSPEFQDENEIPEDLQNEINSYIEKLKSEDSVLDGLGLINMQLSQFHSVSQMFENEEILNHLQQCTTSPNQDISEMAWKVVKKLAGYSEFCCTYFVNNGIFVYLCELLINSTNLKVSRSIVKIFHYIAKQPSKEIYKKLFDSVHIQSIGKKLSPIQVILLVLGEQIDNFTTPEFADVMQNSGFHEDDDLHKLRYTLLKFATSILECNHKLKFNLEITSICEIIIRSLYFPYGELRIIALIATQRAFSYFQEFAFTPYKETGAILPLLDSIKSNNLNIAIEAAQCITQIVKYKYSERFLFGKNGLFDYIDRLFGENMELPIAELSLEAITASLNLMDAITECIEPQSSDEEISFILNKNIFWMLFDFKHATFAQKRIIVRIICHILSAATMTIVESIIDRREDLIPLICSVMEEENDDNLILYLSTLLIISNVFINRNKSQDLIKMLEELDVQDLIDDLIDESAVPVQIAAKKFKINLLGEEENE